MRGGPRSSDCCPAAWAPVAVSPTSTRPRCAVDRVTGAPTRSSVADAASKGRIRAADRAATGPRPGRSRLRGGQSAQHRGQDAAVAVVVDLDGAVESHDRLERGVTARAVGHDSELVEAWEEVLAQEGATLVRGEAGTRLDLGDGVALEILHPGPELVMDGNEADTNDNSVVVRLTYGEAAFMLTGDIEARVERALVRAGVYLCSTVLKVGHHGSDSSSIQTFLDAVRPQVAVISVGQDNRFGHPAEEVLARLEGTLVYRTDEDGTVTISSDGHKLWIETER